MRALGKDHGVSGPVRHSGWATRGSAAARTAAVSLVALALTAACGAAPTASLPTHRPQPLVPFTPPPPSPTSFETSSPTPLPSLSARVTPPQTPGSIRVQGPTTPRPATPRAGTVPHVLVVMEENKGYNATLGACSADPYLCSLATVYASASSWYGVTHPSQPNYVAIASGSAQGCTVDNCVGAGAYPAEDLGGQLSAAGIPWVAWMESMPSPCFTGTSSGGYVLKHNPFVPFKDNLAGSCHIQPYPGAPSAVGTLAGPNAPDFVWISPNLTDDMHDGTVQQGDAWLKANVAPILASPWFTNFPSTVIVTMDEGDGQPNGSLTTEQGGHVPMVVISSNAQGKGSVNLAGDHYGTQRSIEEAYGLALLGEASNPANGDLSSLFG